MKKKIKSSKRGLTFSIESEAFPSGTRFSYLIDQKKKRILIIQSKEGKNTVSRKKSGNRYIPLFDIRANAVKECISQCDHMEIRVYKDTILIDLKGKVSSIIQIPRIALKATGTDTYYQTTVFDWMHESGIGSYEDQKTVSEQIPDVIKVISLFSGAGFLDYPFQKDDSFDIIYAVDQDPSACTTYLENIGDHIVNADIHSISHLPKCNLVIGGPSCKAFSNANRKTRLDNHKDAGLISQYLRIVEETSPEVFVIENVPQFLTVFQGSNLKLIKDSFPEYDISSAIVDDSDLGGFTTRKRGIIIASKIGRIHIPKISLHKKGPYVKHCQKFHLSGSITGISPFLRKKQSERWIMYHREETGSRFLILRERICILTVITVFIQTNLPQPL